MTHFEDLARFLRDVGCIDFSRSAQGQSRIGGFDLWRKLHETGTLILAERPLTDDRIILIPTAEDSILIGGCFVVETSTLPADPSVLGTSETAKQRRCAT